MPAGPLLLLFLATLLELAGATGNFSDAYAGKFEEVVDCSHGTYSPKTRACECDEGWRSAGPTDTLNFFKGSCTQFICSSAQQCQERLRIPNASCPVEGWDCYCGWTFAFGGSTWNPIGAGYMTWGDQSAACMGPLYTLSLWVTECVIWLLLNLWKVLLLWAMVMLPVGQTTTGCRCREPGGMFRLVASLSGNGATCDGRSCMVSTCARWRLYYDLAWSIYVLDLGIWIYCFLLILWLTFLFTWFVVIWLCVVMFAIVFVVMAACSSSDSGGGTGGGLEADSCCDCNDCSCCHHGLDFDCFCCNPYCGHGCDTATAGANVDPLTIFWVGGPQPQDSETDPCCGCCSGCHGKSKCILFIPLLKLLLHLPRHPTNMWGGVVGRLMGTHPMSSRVYMGGNRFVDFLGFRGRADLHGSEDWRKRVANFLQVSNNGAGPHQAVAPAQFAMLQPEGDPHVASNRHNREACRITCDEVKPIAGRRIALVREPFDQHRDNCRPSSFQDYARGQCWICFNSKEGDEWDMWLQCGHLFCSSCSTEMLKRTMPCPLCRQVSWNVRRGPARYCAPVHVPTL